MNNRTIERQKQEADVFAIKQKVRNLGIKEHQTMMKKPNGKAIGGKELEILRKKHRLNGKGWNCPIGTTETYEFGGRAKFVSAIQKQYTEKDLLEKFGKVLSNNPDPDILKEILAMKSRGL